MITSTAPNGLCRVRITENVYASAEKDEKKSLTAWLCTGACHTILLALPKLAAVRCGTVLSTTMPGWLHLAILGSWVTLWKWKMRQIVLNSNKRKQTERHPNWLPHISSLHCVLLTQLCPLNHKHILLCYFQLTWRLSLFISVFIFMLWQWKADVTVLYKLSLAFSECLLKYKPEFNGTKRYQITAIALPVMEAW